MKMPSLKVALLFFSGILMSSEILLSQNTAADDDGGGASSPLSLEFKTAVADDYSNATFGIGWDLKWSRSKLVRPGDPSGTQPYWNLFFDTEILSKGSLLEDEELNQDPLTLNARAFLFARRMTPAAGGFDGGVPDDPFGDAVDDDDAPANPLSSGRSIKDFWSLGAGFDAGLEADQGFDNTACRLSAFGLFLNHYHFRQQDLKNGTDYMLNLIPTFELALDAVHRSEADAAANGAMPDEEYLRLRAIASWRYYLGQHFLRDDSEASWLDALELYWSVQYSQDYGQNAAWEAAGLDESLGWLLELTYDVNDDKSMVIFARASGGRIAPILEDDKSLLFGVRYRF